VASVLGKTGQGLVVRNMVYLEIQSIYNWLHKHYWYGVWLFLVFGYE